LRRRKGGNSFVLGGYLYAVGSDASAERYNVATDTWSDDVANMLERRGFFGAITTGSAGPAEEQDLFDSLITKAAREWK
jgi:hypothetical protein